VLIEDEYEDALLFTFPLINYCRNIYPNLGGGIYYPLGDSVQKEELLHLHMLFVHVKKYYETATSEEVPTVRYDTLHISPVHIHKNKKSHKEAILILGQEIVDHIRQQHQKSPAIEFSDMVTPEIAAEN
jgi:hypothetical protein